MAALQDLKEALKRLPQEEIDARNQRIKRAMDVSLKKSYLPKHVQEVQTPFAFYLQVGLRGAGAAVQRRLAGHGLTLRRLQDAWEQVKLENKERSLLGTGKPYSRTIP